MDLRLSILASATAGDVLILHGCQLFFWFFVCYFVTRIPGTWLQSSSCETFRMYQQWYSDHAFKFLAKSAHDTHHWAEEWWTSHQKDIHNNVVPDKMPQVSF